MFESVREAVVGVVPGRGSTVGFCGEHDVEGADGFICGDEETTERCFRRLIRCHFERGRGGSFIVVGGEDIPTGAAFGACLAGDID